MNRLASATITSMMFIGLDSCSSAIVQTLGGVSWGIAFGPNRASRSSQCATTAARAWHWLTSGPTSSTG